MEDYTEKDKAEAWDKILKTVKDYSDELVDQWIKEIDGLLTFVCPPQRYIQLSVYSLTYPATGGSLLGHIDRIQRPVLPDSSTHPSRSDERYSLKHLGSAGKLPTEPALRQLYRGRLQSFGCTTAVQSAPLRNLAQRSVVHQPRF